MSKMAIGMAAAIALGAAVPAVYAGAKYTNGVGVNTTSRNAGGPMAAGRADGSTRTDIQIVTYGTASYVAAYVMVTDFNGVSAYCYVNSAPLVQLLASANNDAQVWVYWDANGQCTNVYVTNASGFAPKEP